MTTTFGGCSGGYRKIAGVDGEIGIESSESTQYRHRKAILDRLGVTAWGTASRRLAHRTMITVAEARTDPAKLACNKSFSF
jgi:hypothetical protein